MKKALICIDYTNDFVAADGKLTCGEPGQQIEEAVVQITDRFIQQDEYVVFAVDSHLEDDPFHPETKLFPPHNIKSTEGKELYGDLKKLHLLHKSKKNVYYMEKTRYSAFAGTDLEIKLRERDISQIHLIGVCTDICVLHTAVDAYNKGFDIVIHKHAVASFNQTGHEWALSHFQNSIGAEVVE